jgi:hypothetical protein
MRPTGRPRKDATPLPPEALIKECEWCGDNYDKPAIVTWKRWALRRYCDRACYHEHRWSA